MIKSITKFIASTALIAILPVSAAMADTYELDAWHTSVGFKIKHLNSTYVQGRFNDVKGTVVFDAKNPSNNSVNVEIDTNSVDTKVQKRDDHLRSPDFFNVKEFPKMMFKSTSVVRANANNYKVTGNLTLHGVTKKITANFVKMGENVKGMQGELRGGGEVTFKIKRSDFGMNYMLNVVGDEVFVTIGAEGIKK